MHQTPKPPGTGPVTDDPNPDNTQGTIPTEPGTGPGTGTRGANPFQDLGSGGTGGVNPSAPSTGTEGWGNAPDEAAATGHTAGRTFRCAEAGNADCRWEVFGRTEDELMPQIERHAREHHGMSELDENTRTRIRNVMRERRAA